MALTDTVSSNNKSTLVLNVRLVIVALLIAIVALLLIWKPWSQPASARTIKVQGDATVKSVPDEFVFMPSYQSKSADREAALTELTKKSDEVIAKLKELGVPESGIKSSGTAFDGSYYPNKPQDDQTTYNLQLTVTVANALAQKVQDYLVNTQPTGQISPQPQFSTAKRKELENQARTKAIKDAKARADRSAKELGFKVGKVKSVEDGTGFGVRPYDVREGSAISSDAKLSLGVHPGENEIPYTLTVTYFIR